MKTNALCLLLFLITLLANSQGKPRNPVESIIAKNTVQLSFQTSFALGINSRERQTVSRYLLNPKMSYFIADRLSLGINYTGVKSDLVPAENSTLYHNVELEMK